MYSQMHHIHKEDHTYTQGWINWSHYHHRLSHSVHMCRFELILMLSCVLVQNAEIHTLWFAFHQKNTH